MKDPSRKTLWGLTTVAAFAAIVCFAVNGLAASVPGAGIVGSAHDFSALWNTGNNPNAEICVVCHVPHNADSTVTDAPLWNHEVTTATYTIYSSPTLDATVAQPAGVSKLCLSCHDGTVAVDAFDGNAGTQTIDLIDPDHNLTTDLSDDHPISFTYDTALSTADGELFDPASTTITLGGSGETGTIDAVLLYSGKVECASCHDVHNKDTVDGDFLRISRTGSAICLTCHDK